MSKNDELLWLERRKMRLIETKLYEKQKKQALSASKTERTPANSTQTEPAPSLGSSVKKLLNKFKEPKRLIRAQITPQSTASTCKE